MWFRRILGPNLLVLDLVVLRRADTKIYFPVVITALPTSLTTAAPPLEACITQHSELSMFLNPRLSHWTIQSAQHPTMQTVSSSPQLHLSIHVARAAGAHTDHLRALLLRYCAIQCSPATNTSQRRTALRQHRSLMVSATRTDRIPVELSPRQRQLPLRVNKVSLGVGRWLLPVSLHAQQYSFWQTSAPAMRLSC